MKTKKEVVTINYYLSPGHCLAFIKGTAGKFFSCKFIKKDGTLRSINCRIGVYKFVTGKGLNFVPENKGLVTVYDLVKKEYRFINLSTIKEFRIANYKIINLSNKEL